jgi:hypothetical protein
MIRRSIADEFLLVTQTAHARLAADLALEIGNQQFSSPLPRQPVLDAIAMHDAGWPAHDESPTINCHGQPAHALEMPLDIMLPIWANSTDFAAAKHPYGGLLVSLHGLSLSARAHVTATDMPLVFALNKFQHRQIEVQETLRLQLGMRVDRPLHHGLAKFGTAPEEDLLLFDFSLLQLADQLSLNLCFGEAKQPEMANVFPRPGQKAITVRFDFAKSAHFFVDPWPFAKDELHVQFPSRRIPARTYSDHADLCRTYSTAAGQLFHATLRPFQDRVSDI